MIVLANASKAFILSLQISQMNMWTIDLFKNDIEPDGDTLLSAFEPCDFPGAGPKSLAPWSSAYLNLDDQAQTEVGIIQWDMTSSSPTNEIYGYFVTRPGGILVYSERAQNAPFLMSMATSPYIVYAKWLLDTFVVCE